MEDKFVEFRMACACGTNMVVHAEYTEGGFQSRHAVICPKCRKEHEVITRPLRLFYQVGKYWSSGPVE